jgi:hypothetical protein
VRRHGRIDDIAEIEKHFCISLVEGPPARAMTRNRLLQAILEQSRHKPDLVFDQVARVLAVVVIEFVNQVGFNW